MAKTTKAKLDLSTAKTADGQVKGPRSVYEIMGVTSGPYRHHTLAEYGKYIRGLDLFTMQEHAYNVGVVPTHKKDVLVDRLEIKFKQSHAEFPPQAENKNTRDPELLKQVAAILAKGR